MWSEGQRQQGRLDRSLGWPSRRVCSRRPPLVPSPGRPCRKRPRRGRGRPIESSPDAIVTQPTKARGINQACLREGDAETRLQTCTANLRQATCNSFGHEDGRTCFSFCAVLFFFFLFWFCFMVMARVPVGVGGLPVWFFSFIFPASCVLFFFFSRCCRLWLFTKTNLLQRKLDFRRQSHVPLACRASCSGKIGAPSTAGDTQPRRVSASTLPHPERGTTISLLGLIVVFKPLIFLCRVTLS